MRKIILGNFKKDKCFRKRLNSIYRQSMRILRPLFGDMKSYDLVFSRIDWTYSDEGIDFYRRENHTHFYVDERKNLRNIDIRNNIIRAIASENLRKKKFKNEFLMDILSIGGGFYLAENRKDVKISSNVKKEIVFLVKSDKDYSFSRFMDGEEDLIVDFLGYFGAIIIEGVARNKMINRISEKDIVSEIDKYLKNC